MAITIFKKVINRRKTRIKIINKAPKKIDEKINADIKFTRHEISEVKTYD